MGPEEAAYAVKHLLDVKYVIPSHTFPTKDTSPEPEVLNQLLTAFPIVENMMDKDQMLKNLLKDYADTKVVTISYGEEVELRKS
jgi:hypothetical protein